MRPADFAALDNGALVRVHLPALPLPPVYTATSASAPALGPCSKGPKAPPQPNPDPDRLCGGLGARIFLSYRLPRASRGSRRGLLPLRTCFHSLTRLPHAWAAGTNSFLQSTSTPLNRACWPGRSARIIHGLFIERPHVSATGYLAMS